MNSNLFHNIANVASLVLAAATAIMLATGCTTLVTGELECSASWLKPEWTSIAIVGLQGSKIIVNIIRDGITGLAKPQPPVEK